MTIAGIICEFNPLHRGHAYLMAQLRQRGAEAVVCAMSGNFVQRGEPALVNKLSRAEMAVACGADLVLELPTPWAMATAETFARGGVQLLSMAGCTHIGFGSECGDTAALQSAADTLLLPALQADIRAQLAAGITYAAARQRAVEARLGAAAAVLRQPNDTLAVEYLRACRQLRAGLTPIAIRRIGAGHDGGAAAGYASASHIRQLLQQGREGEALSYMPAPAAAVLARELAAGRTADGQNVERAILARLRQMTENEFAAYDGGGEGLYHRVYDAVRGSATVEALLAAAKTKRYTAARLRRMVLSAWLGLPGAPEAVPYARVLAANETGRAILRQMRKAGAPVLTKAADVAALGTAAETLFRREAGYTDLYTLAYADLAQSLPNSDWRLTPGLRESVSPSGATYFWLQCQK